MSKCFSKPLTREREELFTIYPSKEKVLLVFLLFALLYGCCLWMILLFASSLMTFQEWGILSISLLGVILSSRVLITPLRILLKRSPVLIFTDEGIYNYYRFAPQPQFVKWEEVQSLYRATHRQSYTFLEIGLVPDARKGILAHQSGVIPFILSLRPAIAIPQWVMPLTVSELQLQIKQKYALPLQQHHILVW